MNCFSKKNIDMELTVSIQCVNMNCQSLIWTEHDPSSNVLPFWQSNITQKLILGHTVLYFPKMKKIK